MLSSRCSGFELCLILRRGISWCFWIVAGSFELLSIGDGDLREPLMLPQGSQASFHVAGVTLAFLSSHCRGIVLISNQGGKQGSSPDETGISGFLLRFNRAVMPHLMLNHGTLLSSRVIRGMSGHLSSSGEEFGHCLEMQQGSQTSLPVLRGYSGFHLNR